MSDHKEKIGSESVLPYNEREEKSRQIEAMFDHIAPAYDFMNRAMSLGQHRRWRDRGLDLATHRLDGKQPRRILDVATGTGDVIFELASRFPGSTLLGLDLSEGMLNIGRRRLEETELPAGTSVTFIHGDSLALPFLDNEFDLLTVAYGVRNFSDLHRGLSEMARVLKPGGVVCILELSRPASPLPKLGYSIYTRLIPLAGRLVAGDSDAYSYLPKSIAACPQRDAMTSLMEECGFSDCRWESLTMGTICIYTAIKK